MPRRLSEEAAARRAARQAWRRMAELFLAECPFCYALMWKDRLGAHTERHGESGG